MRRLSLPLSCLSQHLWRPQFESHGRFRSDCTCLDTCIMSPWGHILSCTHLEVLYLGGSFSLSRCSFIATAQMPLEAHFRFASATVFGVTLMTASLYHSGGKFSFKNYRKSFRASLVDRVGNLAGWKHLESNIRGDYEAKRYPTLTPWLCRLFQRCLDQGQHHWNMQECPKRPIQSAPGAALPMPKTLLVPSTSLQGQTSSGAYWCLPVGGILGTLEAILPLTHSLAHSLIRHYLTNIYEGIILSQALC